MSSTTKRMSSTKHTHFAPNQITSFLFEILLTFPFNSSSASFISIRFRLNDVFRVCLRLSWLFPNAAHAHHNAFQYSGLLLLLFLVSLPFRRNSCDSFAGGLPWIKPHFAHHLGQNPVPLSNFLDSSRCFRIEFLVLGTAIQNHEHSLNLGEMKKYNSC